MSPRGAQRFFWVSGWSQLDALKYIWSPTKFKVHCGLTGTSRETFEKEIQNRMGLT